MSNNTETPANKHLKLFTNEELKVKMNELENQNSINAEKHADRAFKAFLA